MLTETLEPTFKQFSLSTGLQKRLHDQKYTVPTPIQVAAIPPGINGQDLIGIAQTGTGKTLAFGIPLAENLRSGELGLVLAPTRELAIQIEETLNRLNLKTALLIGGAPMGRQISQLRGRPDVIVATPGRLADHLEQKTCRIDIVKIVVLDEADRMLDMGFAPAIKRILAQTPKDRQTMLFSATMPSAIESLAAQFLRQPVRLECAPQGSTAALVTQELVVVSQEGKIEMLVELLEDHEGSTLVFTRTRHGARKLAKTMRMRGHEAGEIHSDRTLPQRREALDAFKKGRIRVLVATDIAARGIDVKDVALVVNFDAPVNAEDYVHRIGRTGRAGASGHAVTLALPDQHKEVREIEKLIQTTLPLSHRSTMSLQNPRAVGPNSLVYSTRAKGRRR